MADKMSHGGRALNVKLPVAAFAILPGNKPRGAHDGKKSAAGAKNENEENAKSGKMDKDENIAKTKSTLS